MDTKKPYGFSRSSIMARRAGAILYLVLVAAIPVMIVTLTSTGGIWVAGFVTGMVTVPFVALGAMRAVAELANLGDIDIFKGCLAYGVLVTVISVAAALWSLL